MHIHVSPDVRTGGEIYIYQLLSSVPWHYWEWTVQLGIDHFHLVAATAGAQDSIISVLNVDRTQLLKLFSRLVIKKLYFLTIVVQSYCNDQL